MVDRLHIANSEDCCRTMLHVHYSKRFQLSSFWFSSSATISLTAKQYVIYHWYSAYTCDQKLISHQSTLNTTAYDIVKDFAPSLTTPYNWLQCRYIFFPRKNGTALCFSWELPHLSTLLTQPSGLHALDLQSLYQSPSTITMNWPLQSFPEIE